jgi:atypical dual specificity phosphatase
LWKIDYGSGVQAFRAYPLRWAIARATFPAWLATKLLFRHHRGPFWYNRIDETVILGALPLRSVLPAFPGLGIRGVVNLCEEFRGNADLYNQLGIRQLWIPTIDNTCPSLASIERAVTFIEEHRRRGESVYGACLGLHQSVRHRAYCVRPVHCRAGKGRSATVVLCYLMRAHPELTKEQAFALISRARPGVFPSVMLRQTIDVFRSRSASAPTSPPSNQA